MNKYYPKETKNQEIMGRNGSTCAVAVCPSPKGVSYHIFPKEKTLRKAWVDACKRKDQIPVETGRVCSNHFKEEDFFRDLKHELLNLPLRKLLKKDTIPTQNLLPGMVIQSGSKSWCAGLDSTFLLYPG